MKYRNARIGDLKRHRKLLEQKCQSIDKVITHCLQLDTVEKECKGPYTGIYINKIYNLKAHRGTIVSKIIKINLIVDKYNSNYVITTKRKYAKGSKG